MQDGTNTPSEWKMAFDASACNRYTVRSLNKKPFTVAPYQTATANGIVRGVDRDILVVTENLEKSSNFAVCPRERNVLFNDALNTFYLQLYGVRHVVKGHYDSEKGNPLPPHRLLFPISSKGSFICIIPQTG